LSANHFQLGRGKSNIRILLRSVGALLVPVMMLAMSTRATASGGAQETPDTQAQQQFIRGIELLGSDRYVEAEEVFRGMIAGGLSTPALFQSLGVALQKQGKHAEAARQFKSSLDLDPKQPLVRIQAGASLLSAGRTGEAIPLLEEAARELPDEPSAKEQLAEAYSRSGRVLDATLIYQGLTLQRPDDPELLYRLGRLYLLVTEWSLAKLAAAPESARLHQVAGQNQMQKGDFEAAEKSFRKAIELSPQLPDLHLALATVHLRKGRLQDALEEIEAELRLVPWNSGAQQLRDRVTQELKKQVP